MQQVSQGGKYSKMVKFVCLQPYIFTKLVMHKLSMQSDG